MVMVVTVMVTVSNFSIPHTPCTLTRGVRVYHGVGAAQVQLGHTGEHAGHGQGGDTKKVAVVAGRQQREWYGDGSGSCTEAAVAAVVAQRRLWLWHRDGGRGGTETAVVAAQRWRQRWHRDGSSGGTEMAAAVA